MRTEGKALRFLRISKGFSQENLADELKLSVSAFSKIERGMTDLTVSRLLLILTILDASLKEYLEVCISLEPANQVFLSQHLAISRQEESHGGVSDIATKVDQIHRFLLAGNGNSFPLSMTQSDSPSKHTGIDS